MLRARNLRGAVAALAAVCTALPARAQLRPDVVGGEAAVVADHPLAAAAGADVLRRGGNALDAAVTMAAVLAVVRPHMGGLGGDAFLLYHSAREARVFALNGSGRAGELGTPANYHARGLTAVPQVGVLSVTVPGALRLWADALRRFGTIPLDSALAPAIRLAEHGFPVTTRLAAEIAAARPLIEQDAELRALFLPGGAVPRVGSMLRQPALAETLRLIARDGPDVFYVGPLARRLHDFMAAEDGLLRIEDLAAHSSTWQQPLTTSYLGYRVFVPPPSSQGITLLMQMNIAAQFDLAALPHNSAPYLHMFIETHKLVFADRERFGGDPAFHELPLDELLSADYARRQAGRIRDIGLSGAALAADPPEGEGDTAYLAVVDRHGNMVSMIQSLFRPFGSGRVVPGTGILLHNRGAQFSLDTTRIDVIAPRKRTFHTLSPALALRADGSPFMVFGATGGVSQTQMLLQLFNNVALFGMTPQQAAESPRVRVHGVEEVTVENGIAAEVVAELLARGHRVRSRPAFAPGHGGVQMILVLPNGARFTAADPRHEAYGIAW